jgi:hypothetical protein
VPHNVGETVKKRVGRGHLRAGDERERDTGRKAAKVGLVVRPSPDVGERDDCAVRWPRRDGRDLHAREQWCVRSDPVSRNVVVAVTVEVTAETARVIVAGQRVRGSRVD